MLVDEVEPQLGIDGRQGGRAAGADRTAVGSAGRRERRRGKQRAQGNSAGTTSERGQGAPGVASAGRGSRAARPRSVKPTREITATPATVTGMTWTRW